MRNARYTLNNFLNVDLQDTEIQFSASLGLIALLLMARGQMLWVVSLNMYINCDVHLLLTEDECK